MQTVKITTDNKVSIIEVDFGDFQSIQKTIGGYFEIVKTQKMWDYFKFPIAFIADEEGHIKELPINRFASWLYDTECHGWPIVGDIILAIPDGEHITGLVDADLTKEQLLRDFPYLEDANNE